MGKKSRLISYLPESVKHILIRLSNLAQTLSYILTAWPPMLHVLIFPMLQLLQILLMLPLLLQQLLLLLPQEQWHGSPNGMLVGQIGLSLVRLRC